MDLIRKNKNTLKFIAVFTGIYVFGLYFYRVYLSYYDNSIDDITKVVARVVVEFLNFYNTDFKSIELDNYSIGIYIDDYVIVKVIEGCNSINVIILFLAFIISFKKDFKNTLVYSVLGSVFIFILNIFRILVITYGVYLYPKYSFFLHDIFFPMFLYGVVLLLWLNWVRIFIVNNEG